MKKIIGYGILICVVFFAAIALIPANFSPSVSQQINANQFTVQRTIENIEDFRLWDPKAITDSTVSFKSELKNGLPNLVVTDSLERIMATYQVEKSTLEEVQISVNIKNVTPMMYKFHIEPNAHGCMVTWDLEFEGNLMMAMFGVEDQLEASFQKGLTSLSQLIAIKQR